MDKKYPEDMILRHICETCGKEEFLTPSEAYKRGWDYPPEMGEFKKISPRTCGNCGIDTTAWWEIETKNTPICELSSRHRETIKRILTEPDSIMP